MNRELHHVCFFACFAGVIEHKNVQGKIVIEIIRSFEEELQNDQIS